MLLLLDIQSIHTPRCDKFDQTVLPNDKNEPQLSLSKYKRCRRTISLVKASTEKGT